MDEPSGILPTDDFSVALKRVRAHPDGLESTSLVETSDIYGHHSTWVVKTININGSATTFLERSSDGLPLRVVLPPEITAAITRQRGHIVKKARKRGARKAAATREALGTSPNFGRKTE